MMCEFSLRPVTAEDERFLWQMLYYAAHAGDDGRTTVNDVIANPALAKYVQGWGRPGDLGYLAVEDASGLPVGAVWVRLFSGPDKAYSQVDDVTPELAIAVLPQFLGRGIGTQLMQQLLAAAGGRYPAIALNVRAENPAVRLYQRLGFVVIGEIPNRVGGISLEMRYFLSDSTVERMERR